MKDERKTKKQLVNELEALRQRVAALEKAEGFYRDVLEGVADGVFATDSNDVIRYGNRGVEAMSGLSREDTVGRHLRAAFSEQSFEFFLPHYVQARDSLQPVRFEAVPVVLPDGRRRFLSGWIIPQTKDGRFDGMLGTVVDVTGRRQADEELREHRERLEELVQERSAELALERAQLLSIFDGIGEPIYVSDLETHEVLYVNAELEKRVGENAVGEKCYRAFHGRDAVCDFCTNAAILEDKGSTLCWEHHNVLLDRDYLLFDRVIRWPDGRDVRFELAIDITERKLAGEALAHERGLFDALLDNVPDQVYFKDRESRFLRNSASHLRFLGVGDQADAKGKTDFDFFDPDHAAAAYADEQRIVETGEPLIGKLEHIRKWDGTFVWVTASKAPLYDRAGGIIGTVGITRDVDEQVRLQAERDEHRRMLQAVLDAVPDHIVFKDRNSAFQLCNRQALDFLGLSMEAVAGKTDLDWFSTDDAQRYRDEELRAMETGETVISERPLPGPFSTHWEEATKVPMRDENGEIIGVLSIGRDVTERRELEEQLRLTQATVDSAAVGICWVSPEGRFVYVNEATCRQLGYTREELLEMHVWDASDDPDHSAETRASRWEMLKRDRSLIFEVEQRNKDGSQVPIEITAQYVQYGGQEYELVFAVDITDRKRAEEILAEERNLLRTLIDSVPDHIFVEDLEGRIILINVAEAHHIGLDHPDEAIGKTDDDLFPSDLAELYRKHDEMVIRSGQPLEVEEPVVSSTGERRWTWTIKVPLRDSRGEVIGLVGISRDITERREMEDALREREKTLAEERNLLRTLIDALPDHIYVKDLEGKLLLVNRAQAHDMSLSDPDEVVGKTDFELTAAEFAELWHRHDVNVMQSGKPLWVEEPFLDPEGELRYAYSVKVPWRDKDGRVVGLVGMSRDVTERKKEEEDLRHRLGLEAALAHISRHLADPEEVDLNHVLQVLGEAIGVNRAYVFQLRDGGRMMDNTYEWCAPGAKSRMAAFQGLNTVDYPWWMGKLGRGEIIVIPSVTDLPEEAVAEKEILQEQDVQSGLVLPLRWSSGELQGFVGFDYTESERAWSEQDVRVLEIVAGTLGVHWDRRRADEALRESEDLLRRVINAVPAFVAVKDSDGNFVQANARAAEVYATTTEDMIGRNQLDYVELSGLSEDELSGYLEVDRKVIDSKQPAFIPEEVFTRPDGTQTWIQTVKTPLATRDNPDCVLVVGFDITERKKLEEQLRQSQKMEAVGTLAGGVAHDFNNLLTGIVGYSEFLLRDLDPGSLQYEDVLGIRRSADRATDLTRQLLAFSRRQILQPKILDLNEVVGNIMKMLERLVGEDIDLKVKLNSDLGKVEVDPGQIEQVVMNLVVNAREAMPEGGLLSIETKNVVLDESHAREHPEFRPGVYAMLAVSDTGTGMDGETLSRIFEPFFTTKELGTGLGLSTVYGIVKQSGGHLSADSEPGSGTTLKVYLPLVDEPRSSGPAGSARPDVAGSETILLVEDDDMVRRLARRSLEHLGYTVLEASSGGEALRIHEGQDETIDLLLTDVVMPSGMSGRRLAERIESVHPEVKVLYMSGYTDDAIVRRGVLAAGTPFLEKPFTPDKLATAVRAALDA